MLPDPQFPARAECKPGRPVAAVVGAGKNAASEERRWKHFTRGLQVRVVANRARASGVGHRSQGSESRVGHRHIWRGVRIISEREVSGGVVIVGCRDPAFPHTRRKPPSRGVGVAGAFPVGVFLTRQESALRIVVPRRRGVPSLTGARHGRHAVLRVERVGDLILLAAALVDGVSTEVVAGGRGACQKFCVWVKN